MSIDPIDNVDTLTFDIFGTVLDLTGGIVPELDRLLKEKGASIDGPTLWPRLRARQRIEQYQDTIISLGHSGYLETVRRAFVYTLRAHQVAFEPSDAEQFLSVFERLTPFDDAVTGLNRLSENYRLVALSNGNRPLVEKLVAKNINAPFDAVFSVDEVGRFKPHPAVYRAAAQALETEPGRVMMVAAHSFDIMGARACGFRGAYVNRYQLPYEDSPHRPDVTVDNFVELADWLMQRE